MMQEPEIILAGWPIFFQIVASVALSLLASRLAAKKAQPPFQEAPTPLTTRGARIPIIMGRRVVRPIFAAVGDRYQQGPDWFEKGLHVLCMGPASALHSIQRDGEGVLPLILTPVTHPSGTLVTLANEGQFRIYWGEIDQPTDPLLIGATPGFLGLPTNLPGVCYIVWGGAGKELGPAPVWDQLRYEIEVRIQETGLTQSPPYYIPSAGGVGSPIGNWFHHSTTSAPGWLVREPKFSSKSQAQAFIDEFFPVGSQQLVEGSPGQDGIYFVAARQLGFTTINPVGGITPAGWAPRVRLSPVINWGVLGFGNSVTLAPLDLKGDAGGCNPAHAIWQLLFGGWPWGLELDEDAVDMASLEDLGKFFAQFPGRVNLAIQDGETVEAALTKIMREHGIVRYYDRDGRIAFTVLRQDAPVFTVPTDAVLSPLPEVGAIQGPRPVGKVNFKFNDVDRNFADNVIDVGDDASEEWLGIVKERDVELFTAIDFDTASEIADRRAPEELGDLAQLELAVGREGRDASIGQVLAVESVPGTWRILSRRRSTLSSLVDLSCIADPWSVPPSDLPSDPSQPGQTPEGLAPDLLLASLEIPPWWGLAGTVEMAALRVRNSATILPANVFVSSSPGGSVQPLAQAQQALFGGVLAQEIPEQGIQVLGLPWGLPGPLVEPLGPDQGIVLDLTANIPAWLAGEQVAVLGGGPDAEICHLQGIEQVGDQVRLLGLSRARYDTRRRTWPVGTPIWIGPRNAVLPASAASLAPLVTRFLRAPVATESQVQPLAEADEVAHALEGKGVRPIRVRNLRAGPPVVPGSPSLNLTSFIEGQTIVIDWSESLPTSTVGAGLGGYGDAAPAGTVVGDFLVEFIYLGAVVGQITTTFRGGVFSYAELFTSTSPPALIPGTNSHAEREFSVTVYHRIPAGSTNEADISVGETITLEPV